jgi:hypothetical protein
MSRIWPSSPRITFMHGVDVDPDGQPLGVEELPDRVHDERPLGDVRPNHRHRREPPLRVHVRVHDLDVNPVRAGRCRNRKFSEDHVGERRGHCAPRGSPAAPS